jgi:hypothetical protein
VLPEWLSAIPPWLLAGVLLGSGLSCCVAVVFVVGGRLFPTTPVDRHGGVDGTLRRRQELRQYLVDVGERFLEDYPVHGETVAFYLPERDVAITFDAKAYFRIEEAGTYAVLCEFEMPARGLGRRLPFEVPDIEPEVAPNPVTTAFAELDLAPEASPDEVKSAYRTKIKDAHPDHGGTTEEFKRLQEAYATARDHAAADADAATA